MSSDSNVSYYNEAHSIATYHPQGSPLPYYTFHLYFAGIHQGNQTNRKLFMPISYTFACLWIQMQIGFRVRPISSPWSQLFLNAGLNLTSYGHCIN